MTEHRCAFPLAYRWFITRGLTDWQPWSFIDTPSSITEAPNLMANLFACNAFKAETSADFEVYLFARRQDRDDFAFFVVENGRIMNDVYSVHLSFSGRHELLTALRRSDRSRGFIEWMQLTVMKDVNNWMSEEDLS